MSAPIKRKVVKADRETQTHERAPDEDGFHYVSTHDGVRLRFRLLLGGPQGNGWIDDEKYTAICLHGLGERLESWEEGGFRQQELPPSFAHRLSALAGEASDASSHEAGRPQKARQKALQRRAKLVQGLARRMNVALLDLRGFGGSGRPRSHEAMRDTSLTALYTFTLSGDMGTFTEAARADIQLSRHFGTESHTISVSGSTVLVCTVHRGVARFLASLHRLQLGLQHLAKSPVRLFKLDLCGQREVLAGQNVALADLARRQEVRCFTMHPKSYKVDRMGRQPEDVLVIHDLELRDDDEEQLRLRFDRCFEEMTGDLSCLSFSVSRCRTSAILQASLASVEAAVEHLRRVEGWLGSGEEAILGWMARLDWAKLHARGPAIKRLKASTELQNFDVQLFQLFPLSFQSPSATEVSANMEDFVQDVESVRQYLGTRQAVVIGHSFGAAVALRHAVECPHSVSRLVALGGWARMPEDARDMWELFAGNKAGWTESVIRGALFNTDIEDVDLHRADAPMLLVNAKDDSLVPVESAQELRRALPRAMLALPSHGGHDAMAVNEAVLERVVQFLLAEEALLFADNPLCAEMIASPWNLGSDKAFVRYWQLGQALAEVEHAHRRVRLIWNWVRDGEFQDERWLQEVEKWRDQSLMDERIKKVESRQSQRVEKIQEEEQAKIWALRKVGLEEYIGHDGATPTDILLQHMDRLVEEMSAPARLAVEQAGLWWRDAGRAAEGLEDGKYTVDAWGIRRGGSKKTSCAWFRWDLHCVPPELREGYAYEEADAEMFTCWWCGGTASDHDNLGRMADNEEPGYYPGLGPGRLPWQPPLLYGLPTGHALVLDEDAEALRPLHDVWDPPFQRIRVQ